MPTIRIPTPLRSYSQNRSEVKVTGATVRQALTELEKSCPGIGARLLDEKGAVKRYVNVFFNDEDIRFLQELDTKVADNDTVSLIPAIAGGV